MGISASVHIVLRGFSAFMDDFGCRIVPGSRGASFVPTFETQ